MGIVDWTTLFELTSSDYADSPIPGSVVPTPPGDGRLPLNQAIAFNNGTGYYRLVSEACSLTNTVRETKDFIPQADGSILHRRFLGGMEMGLTVQMWAEGTIACDELLQEMVDVLNGYLYGLLNAGDNRGRISWALPGGGNDRMLDDLRLLGFPVESQQRGSPFQMAFTVDTYYPYAEDLTPTIEAMDPVGGVITNSGNRPTYPVWRMYDGIYFTITNVTTGDVFQFDSSQPGCPTVNIGDFVEINTFRDTIFLNGNGANLKPGIVMVNSDFFTLPPGANTISISGLPIAAGSECEINSAWQ